MLWSCLRLLGLFLEITDYLFSQSVEGHGQPVRLYQYKLALRSESRSRILHPTVVLAQLGQGCGSHRRPTQSLREKIERELNISGKLVQLGWPGVYAALHKTGFKPQHRVGGGVGTGKDRSQKLCLKRLSSGFCEDPIHRSLQIRTGSPPSTALFIKRGFGDLLGPAKIFHYLMKVLAASIDKIRNRLRDLGPFPSRPNGIGEEGKDATNSCIERSKPNCLARRNTNGREQKYDQTADGYAEDAVICGTKAAEHKRECTNKEQFSQWGLGNHVIKQSRQGQAEKCAGQTQNSPAEGGCEIRLQHNGNGHGNPIGALPAYAAADELG